MNTKTLACFSTNNPHQCVYRYTCVKRCFHLSSWGQQVLDQFSTAIKYLAYLLSRPSCHVVHTWRATSTELVTTFKARFESVCKSITGLLFQSHHPSSDNEIYNKIINYAKAADSKENFVFPREQGKYHYLVNLLALTCSRGNTAL